MITAEFNTQGEYITMSSTIELVVACLVECVTSLAPVVGAGLVTWLSYWLTILNLRFLLVGVGSRIGRK
jgi:hypothetical protein